MVDLLFVMRFTCRCLHVALLHQTSDAAELLVVDTGGRQLLSVLSLCVFLCVKQKHERDWGVHRERFCQVVSPLR